VAGGALRCAEYAGEELGGGVYVERAV